MDGKTLKIFRVKSGLTLAKASQLIGITPSALSRIENGAVQPQELTVYKIYKIFPEAFRQTDTPYEEFTQLFPETEKWCARPKKFKESSLPLFSMKKEGQEKNVIKPT